MEFNPTLDNGYEHRIGAKLHDYDYNDTIDKEDMVGDIRRCIDSLYTTSLDKQRAACNIRRVGGLMSDFTNDISVNSYYGFSNTSFSLKFPLKNVFFFNSLFVSRLNRHSKGYARARSSVNNNVNSARHRAFCDISEVYPTPMSPIKSSAGKVPTIHTRGGVAPPTEDIYNIKFNINDTVNRPDIFTHRLLFFMNGWLLEDVMMYVVPNYVIIVIDCEKGGLDYNSMMRVIDPSYDDRWTLIGLPFGNSYTTPSTGSLIGSINDTDIDFGDYDQIRTYKLDGDKEVDVNIIASRYTMADGLNMNMQYSEPSSGRYLVGSTCGAYGAYKYRSLCIGNLKTTTTKATAHFSDGTIRETLHKDYALSCLGDSQYQSFESMTKMMIQANSSDVSPAVPESYRKIYLDFIELKNFASVIYLGANRIFQVGCSSNIPGPIPPENILIFNASDGYLRLEHMVDSTYKNTDLSDATTYNKKVFDGEHPNEKMIPFKPPAGYESVYDFKKFIPTRDDYPVPSGTYGPGTERTHVKYIEHYFPNVYKLTGFSNTANLVAVVFYDKACDNSFDNPLASYMQYDANYANNLISGNIPRELKAYIPEISKYTEDMYLNTYHTKATRAVEHQFKLEALRELVNDDYRRLIDIYDRRYKKQNNKMHSNVKYIIDLTKDSTDASNDKKYGIRHFYRDQLTTTYRTKKFSDVTTINVIHADPNVEMDSYTVEGVTLYMSVSPANNYAINTSICDVNGNRILPDMDPNKYIIVNLARDELNKVVTINIAEDGLLVDPVSSYKLFLNHKDATQFPATVWVDGSRLSNDYYDIGTSAFASYIFINKNITTGAHYIEIELYKMENIDSLNTIVELTDIHDSTKIPQGIWPDLSPQNTLVTIEEDTLDVHSPTGHSLRYRVPSSYESYWLLIGHTQYIKGVPVNIDINERQNAYIFEYNVIKSLQAAYTDGSGRTVESSEVVILADDNVALIGETDEVFNGNIDLLKTFGDEKYFKTKAVDETIYMQLVNNNERYKSICEIKRNFGLTDYEKSRYMALSHKIAEGEELDETEQAEYDEYVDKLADYAENGLSAEDRIFYLDYTQMIEDMGFDTHFTEYVTMLREGFYNRDRKRFYDYLPMKTSDPEVFITPITPFFANKRVKIMNTDVYFSKTLNFTYVNGTIINKSIKIRKFGFDPSQYKFRVYLDGKLLDYDYDYITDVHLDNQNFYLDSDLTIFFRCNFDVHRAHEVIFEYLPYKYQLIHRSAEYDGIITLGDEYIRPFDSRNFDVYINGMLIAEDDITMVTERRISLNSIIATIANNSETHPIVSIYERMHDADVYDYVWRNHKEAFNYIDHDNPTIYDPTTGTYVDNVKRNPNDPNEFIDVKKAQRLKFSLHEQLMRGDAGYRNYRTPTYDPSISGMEINNWIFGK